MAKLLERPYYLSPVKLGIFLCNINIFSVILKNFRKHRGLLQSIFRIMNKIMFFLRKIFGNIAAGEFRKIIVFVPFQK